MVRAGVVEHPDQWAHGGYREIQAPRRKCILIDYDRLKKLCGFDDFESFQAAQKQLKALAIGRRIVPTTDGWELREEASSYNPFSEGQKVDIDHENTYSWEEIDTISMC